MQIGKHSSKWINSAKRRRVHAKFRRHLCRILGCPMDSCYSTGELLRDARRERDERRAALAECFHEMDAAHRRAGVI
jgi:hypothetical protein